jgi:hypothetical protein
MGDGMTDRQQLYYWQQATGRDKPGEDVPIGVSVTVGRTTFRTYGEKLPPIIGMLTGKRKGPARKNPKPAMFGALCAAYGWRKDKTDLQRVAWENAIRTGVWA